MNEKSAKSPTIPTATIHRDLRDGTSYWLARRKRPAIPHRALDARIAPDVVVVGSGISGALITDALVTAGFRVAALDRRGVMLGSTPASTALLQFEIDMPLTQLARKIGREKAMRAWWRSVQGVAHLRDRVLDLGIDCDFADRSSLYLPGNLLNATALRREAVLRRAAGLRSELIDRRQLKRYGIDRPAAIYSRGTAEADPVKLTAGLWRANLRRGAKIYAPAEVMDVASFRDHVRVKVAPAPGERLRAITARAVIFATGYEMLKFIRPKGYKVASTWAYATRVQKAALWPEHCLIWEAADPYLYARATRDGHVLVGGEDEDTADPEIRNALLPAKVAAIEAKLKKLLPRLDPTPLYAWSGTFGTSETGLPAIGAVPGHRNCYAAMGFGGNGITFSAIAAQMFQRRLSGVADPDEDLFAL